jgi:uncharacterized RDD family membrane protein YckC
MTDNSQTKLLRIAAFLVDALSIALMLILPASAVSYAMTWTTSPKGIQLVWWAALAILMLAMLLRDGFRRRSIGKQLLGLRVLTPKGEGCGYGRSLLRNFPLVVPGWNLLEVMLVLSSGYADGSAAAS